MPVITVSQSGNLTNGITVANYAIALAIIYSEYAYLH